MSGSVKSKPGGRLGQPRLSSGPPSASWTFVMLASDRALRLPIMDDGVQAFMRAMNDGFPAVETMSAAEARAAIVGRRLPVDNLDDVAGADDRMIPGPDGDVPVRVYRPHGDSGARPAVVFCARRRFRAVRPGLPRRLLPGDVAAHRDGRRVGGLPARAGASRARGRRGCVRRVVLGDRRTPTSSASTRRGYWSPATARAATWPRSPR